MLSRENDRKNPDGVVIPMSDTAIIAASMKVSLLEIAKQAKALGIGLQNAAPSGGTSPNNSVQYLLDIGESIEKIADQCGS